MQPSVLSSGFHFRKLLPLLVLAVVSFATVPAFAKVKGTGDFNHDGFADLCVGVPDAKVGNATAAGAVNCLYGSPSGLQANTTPAAQLWTQNSAGISGTSDANDQFGSAIAVGDFNGDGFDDVCVGAPLKKVSGLVKAGAVTCIYGSPAGLGGIGIGIPSAQIWKEGTAGVPGTLAAGDRFGSALAAGDFNHDGFVDLCITANGKTVGGQANAGQVTCLYGSAAGLQANGTGAPAGQIWNQNSAGIGGTPAEFHYFGGSLEAGDFNGDGYRDLCIGVINDDLATVGFAGSVTCLYGSPSGLQTTGVGGPKSQRWSKQVNGVKGTAQTFDQFGTALAVGDFNHDGFSDLAIGAPGDPGNTPKGSVNVLYGSPTGLQASGTGGPNDQLWTRDSTSVKGTSALLQNFGAALVAGDFNNDRFDDLCIGAPFDAGSGTIVAAGSVSCLYGSNSGLQATGTGGPNDQLWNQETFAVFGTSEESDQFGSALASGDFNGDGFFDLAVGVPGKNHNEGSISVLYGSHQGLQSTGTGAPSNQFFDQNSVGIPGSGGGMFGFSFGR